MVKIRKITTDYYRAPKSYFWQWADNGEVIEWSNGSTICYRDELISILKGCITTGLPPIAPVLLILAACNDNWQQADSEEILRKLSLSISEGNNEKDEVLEHYERQALKLMKIVSQLPHDLRTGTKKMHLVLEVFTGQELPHNSEDARGILEEFSSGRLDQLLIPYKGKEPTRERYKDDLAYLDKALQTFKSSEILELKLRTGVYHAPQPAEIEEPDPGPLDLLTELEYHPQTTGIARLTRGLIAAFNIPMHSHGSSDLPIGGISDITNRGDYDKMLLSELANDEDLLMARLVNNEALYYRREEPPDEIDRQRTILLDTTIKMWGVPRVFSLSAALACSHNTKHLSAINAFAMGADSYTEIDLATKDGVLTALQHLDTSLHCTKALSSFMKEMPRTKGTDIILITGEDQLQQRDLQVILPELRDFLSFLITVSRNGELHFYEFRNGTRKLLSSARFDLDELLLQAPAAKKKKRKDQTDRPAFLQLEEPVIYGPVTGMKVSARNTYYDRSFGVVGITETFHVLYWPKRETGAIEAFSYIEDGKYCFTHAGKSFYVLCCNSDKRIGKVYKYSIDTHERDVFDLSQEIDAEVKELDVRGNIFYVKLISKVIAADADNRTITFCTEEFIRNNKLFEEQVRRYDLNPIKKFINNGYSTLKRPRALHMNTMGRLAVDVYHIDLLHNNNMITVVEPVHTKQAARAELPNKFPSRTEYVEGLVDNPYAKFHRSVWADGSEAIMDSRGYVHLRSSDPDIPEITIVLIIGKGTACWASNGATCGSSYFTGMDASKVIPADQFYSLYIQRFIDKLEHATETAS